MREIKPGYIRVRTLVKYSVKRPKFTENADEKLNTDTRTYRYMSPTSVTP